MYTGDDLMRIYVNALRLQEDARYGTRAQQAQIFVRDEFLRRESEDLSSEFLPMLRCLGYHVRYNGFTETARIQLLRNIVGMKLPHINGAEYMAEWGEPATAKRVRALYKSIRTYLHRYGSKTELELARERWESDLSFLEGLIEGYR